jgi:hypothetical protein
MRQASADMDGDETRRGDMESGFRWAVELLGAIRRHPDNLVPGISSDEISLLQIVKALGPHLKSETGSAREDGMYSIAGKT